jgi:hypothetical protein
VASEVISGQWSVVSAKLQAANLPSLIPIPNL